MKGMDGIGDMGKMMQQAQSQIKKMQDKMGKVDETLKERVVEGSAGGGMVKVLFNGLKEPLDVEIDPMVFEDEDPEFLQEMILAAVRQGLKKAEEIEEEEKEKIAGNMGIPGLSNFM
ncbi:MAG: YbaB/EbfC family nucleoid-associated protein [Planctomycetota bacterium]